MEMTYTVITETKDKNLRRLYWDIALYIKSLDRIKPSNWFHKLIESSIDLEIDCEEVINKLKEYYGKFKDDEFDKNFNSVRIYQLFVSGGFNSRPIAPSLIFKHILQDKFTYMGIIRPKEKFTKLFEAERQFCYNELSKSEQIIHLKQFFSDLLDVKQFANIYNKMVIATYIIWYMIGTKWDMNDYKTILGGESNERNREIKTR